MKPQGRWTWLAVGLSAGLLLLSLLTRSYVPIDETRYVSVAWEMWLRQDFLVPYENGQPYSHKPPLLFWLITAGWWLFGVNEWSPRMVAPLFSLASLILLPRLARLLWPDEQKFVSAAPLVLAGSGFWLAFATATMFDMLVVFFTLLGLLGVLLAWRDGRTPGWLLFGMAIGMGVLAKGPVILLHVLPPALLAPWWAVEQRPERWAHWYTGILLATALGAAIALAWALPAATAGGEAYAKAILWGQTAGRMVKSFAHRRELWWYLPSLAVVWLPLALWPGFWRTLWSTRRNLPEAGTRFCLAWFFPVLLVLSLISGKQVHYLLPLFPALALLGARGLEALPPERPRLAAGGVSLLLVGGLLAGLSWGEHFLSSPWGWREPAGAAAWGLGLMASGLALLIWRRAWTPHQTVAAMAVCATLLLAVFHLGLIPAIGPAYDLRPVSAFIGDLQRRGIAIAHIGDYADQYHFLGRLREPLLELDKQAPWQRWLQEHPRAAVIHYAKAWTEGLATSHPFAQPYRNGAVLVSLGEAVDAPSEAPTNPPPSRGIH